MNLFSGARRAAAALGILWTAGCIAAAVVFMDKPTFYYDGNGSVASQAPPWCAYADDGLKKVVQFGNDFDIVLCFDSAASRDADALFPEDSATGKVAATAKSSPETQRIVSAARSEMRSMRFKHWREVASVWAAAGAAGWIAVAIIGWIVRGFLGIPSGMDRRA